MMTTNTWQPNISINNLKKRAQIIAKIRAFFASKDVIEVETPALSQATVTDLHLQSFSTKFFGTNAAMQNSELHLQTSPEFAMKRLLCAGSGCIYQISKAFRNEEAGRFHNPEFTMLEWYRVDFDHFQLMNELSELLIHILDCEKAEQVTYQQLFIKYVGVDPLACSLDELKNSIKVHQLNADWVLNEDNFDTLLQYLFSELVESKIGKERPCLVYNFPASQASLAQISIDDKRVAQRFELYFKGMELANGFNELRDASEQKLRFKAENQLRTNSGKDSKAIDANFIAALEHGLPKCAGVALGVDRLIMIALNQTHIENVISFSVNRA